MTKKTATKMLFYKIGGVLISLWGNFAVHSLDIRQENTKWQREDMSDFEMTLKRSQTY